MALRISKIITMGYLIGAVGGIKLKTYNPTGDGRQGDTGDSPSRTFSNESPPSSPLLASRDTPSSIVDKHINIFDWDEAVCPTDHMWNLYNKFWKGFKKTLSSLKKVSATPITLHMFQEQFFENNKDESSLEINTFKRTIEEWKNSQIITKNIITDNYDNKNKLDKTKFDNDHKTIIISNGSWNDIILRLMQTQVIFELLFNFNNEVAAVVEIQNAAFIYLTLLFEEGNSPNTFTEKQIMEYIFYRSSTGTSNNPFVDKLERLPLYQTLMHHIPIVTFWDVAILWDDIEMKEKDLDVDDVNKLISVKCKNYKCPMSSLKIYEKIFEGLDRLIEYKYNVEDEQLSYIPPNVIEAGKNVINILNEKDSSVRYQKLGENQSDVKLFFTYIAIRKMYREIVTDDPNFVTAVDSEKNRAKLYLESTGDRIDSEGIAYENLKHGNLSYYLTIRNNLKVEFKPFREVIVGEDGLGWAKKVQDGNLEYQKGWGMTTAWKKYLDGEANEILKAKVQKETV